MHMYEVFICYSVLFSLFYRYSIVLIALIAVEVVIAICVGVLSGDIKTNMWPMSEVTDYFDDGLNKTVEYCCYESSIPSECKIIENICEYDDFDEQKDYVISKIKPYTRTIYYVILGVAVVEVFLFIFSYF